MRVSRLNWWKFFGLPPRSFPKTELGIILGVLLFSCDEWYQPSTPPIYEMMYEDGSGCQFWREGDTATTYTVELELLDGVNTYTTRTNFSIPLRRYARSVSVTVSGAKPSIWHPGYSYRSYWFIDLYPCQHIDTIHPFGIAFQDNGEHKPVKFVSTPTVLKPVFWVDSLGQELVAGGDATKPVGLTEQAYIILESERYPRRLAIAPPTESLSGRTRLKLADSSYYWLWIDRRLAGYDTADHFVPIQVVLPKEDSGRVRVRTAYQTKGGLRWVLME